MKIYFSGSIRGGRDDQKLYLEIINYLKKHGDVLTEHVGDGKLTSLGKEGENDSFIYNRDMKWLENSDVIIAEVSTPSLGVGFEIAKSTENNKRILCLFKPQKGKKLSAMIAGCPDLTVKKYNDLSEAKEIINEFLNQ